jgi:gluconokinase
MMIMIVAGVSGSGKTTVGATLARRLGWPFADADTFHPAANVAKMRAGVSLTDDDRWPWLRAIGAWMDGCIAGNESAVVTCSALKRSYRDLLLHGRPQARMVFLSVDRDVLARRLAARHGHFFPGQLLGTQLNALEPPQPDENVITIVPAEDPAATVAAIIEVLWPAGNLLCAWRRRLAVIMKLKLDLHDIYNRGQDIDRALNAIIDEAVAKKAPLVEIIPGKGSGQLKKHVLKFLEQKEIKAKYHRIEKDSKNFGRVFVHFRW